MPIYTIDVTFSTSFPVNAAGDDWRRYRIAAPDVTSARLAACQWCQQVPGRTSVADVVIDWADD